jgi:HD-GYP domain-containing protein (c-di-GMP phosphodiesterase class II)
VKLAALQHHERADGSGYPRGLQDDEIDEFASIIAIADVYDAMTAARVYRGPLCPFRVIEIFEQEGFEKYDVEYVLTFLEHVVNTYIQNRCLLSDGRQAEIIFVNKDKLSRPMVQCGDEYINLADYPDLTIEKLL